MPTNASARAATPPACTVSARLRARADAEHQQMRHHQQAPRERMIDACDDDAAAVCGMLAIARNGDGMEAVNLKNGKLPKEQ